VLVIIDADAFEIAHPVPIKAIYIITPPYSFIKTDSSSPQSGFCPSA
jgi:hypothetical protein